MYKMLRKDKTGVLNLELDEYILEKQRDAILACTQDLLLKNLSNSDAEIISGIQSRLKELSNDKVRNHVIDKLLKGFMTDGYSGNVSEELENTRDQIKTLIEDPDDEELSKYYPGRNKDDFEQLYWILYGGKEREVKSIVGDIVVEQSKELISQIKFRLEKIKNVTIRNRVEVILKNLNENPRITSRHIKEMKDELKGFFEGYYQELKKTYPGWTEKDIKDLYWVYYGEDIEE